MKIASFLAAVLLLASVAAHAQPVTALWYERVGGAQAPGDSRSLQAPPTPVQVISNGLDAFELFFALNTAQQVRFAIAPAPGGTLAPGAFEAARRYRVTGTAPGVELNDSVGCVAEDGRFVVLDVQVDAQQKITSLAVNFEILCTYDYGRIYGEARFASSIPFTRDEAAGQTLPDAMAFSAVRHARPGETRISDGTTVYGINSPAPIQVSGGEYSVNGGAFTSAPGNVVNRDRVRVRTTSPSTHGSEAVATLMVGGVPVDYRVRTFLPGEPISALRLKSFANNGLFPPGEVDLVMPEWQVGAMFASKTAIQVRAVGRGSDIYAFDLSALDGELALGPREGLNSLSQADWRLTFGGLGFGCSGDSRIVILEMTWRPDGFIDRFAADFENRCHHATGSTFGELRINSAVPLSWMVTRVDATPDAFALVGERVASPGQVVDFAPFAVHGINTAAAINVSGAEYSVNGGAFTSAPGTVAQFDRVAVRTVAGPQAGDDRVASVTIGGLTASATVHTWSDGDTVTGAWSRLVLPGGTVREHLVIASPHRIEAHGDDTSVIIRPHHRDGTSLYFGLGAGHGNRLVPGRYVDRPGDFFGPGLSTAFGGCIDSENEARFVVYEYERDSGGALQRFAADIEFRCSGADAFSQAALRLNSTRPLPALRSRPPCTAGDSDGDGMSDCQELEELRHPGLKDNDIFSDARLFAMQQYRDFLAREGDSDGVDHWASQVASNTTSRGAVIEQFLNSAEFGGVMAPVARLYFAYFLRIPDKNGLDFWVDFHRAGNPMESISNYFAQSTEFAMTYGALDNAAFVDRVYRNVLGRAPDAGGLAYWRDQLDRNLRTRGQVMLAFSESLEYSALTANEIFVTMTYMGMLQRAPEEGGFAYWVDYMDRGNSGLALIDAFLGAAEYRSRFLP